MTTLINVIWAVSHIYEGHPENLEDSPDFSKIMKYSLIFQKSLPIPGNWSRFPAKICFSPKTAFMYQSCHTSPPHPNLVSTLKPRHPSLTQGLMETVFTLVPEHTKYPDTRWKRSHSAHPETSSIILNEIKIHSTDQFFVIVNDLCLQKSNRMNLWQVNST